MDPRHVQQVIDEADEAIGGHRGRAERLASRASPYSWVVPARREPARVAESSPQLQRSERGFELVGSDGDELVADADGRAAFDQRGGQREHADGRRRRCSWIDQQSFVRRVAPVIRDAGDAEAAMATIATSTSARSYPLLESEAAQIKNGMIA